MAIKDIQPKQGNITIEAEVQDVGTIREFSKFGKSGRVASARIKDESGACALSLWNEQVDLVKSGDRIRITNGWANEFQGELQLSTGRFGTLEVLGHSEAAPAAPKIAEQQNPEEKPEFFSNQPPKDLSDEVEEEDIADDDFDED
jgi:replication factor A1